MMKRPGVVRVDVSCPNCETKYHLNADMLGKTMLCPECRDVFTVTSAELPPPVELPYDRIEAPPPVILEAEPVVSPRSAVLLPPLPKAIPLPVKSDPVREKKPSAGGVLEADWRNAPPPQSKPDPAAPVVKELELPRPPRNVWPLVLTSLIVLIIILGASAAGIYLYKDSRKEEVLTQEAETAYRDRNYPEASKKFAEVIEQYPGSSNRERLQFLAALSDLENTVTGTAVKENPAAARAKWDTFLKEHSGSALAKTDEVGFGVDVFDSGRKLLEGYIGHAENLLKQYRGELARRERLALAEAAIGEARNLINIVDRYRPKDVPPLDDMRTRMDGLTAEFARERKRLEVIDPYRDLAADPVEERIAEFGAALARHGFSGDAEGQALIADAAAKLRSLLVAQALFIPPQPLVLVDDKPLVTIAAPVNDPPAPPGYPELAPETILASARGWIYALDADRGDLLWAVRTGPSSPPTRTSIPDGGADLVLVPSRLDGQAALTARRLRTGEPLWHQKLPAGVAGTLAIVGKRVFVPLADAAGSILEFDLVTGHMLSTLRLRQRIGPGIVRIPQTNWIAVVADARRIFILDAAPQNADGERLLPRLMHVLRSEHPELSLRVPPVFVGADKPTMLLVQSEGTGSSKVRAIALPELTPGDGAISESSATELASAVLSGHVRFAPASDGERAAIVTDTGAFAIFRVKTPYNLDPGLFALPANPIETGKEPLPAAALLTPDDGAWVFSRSHRSYYRQSFTPVTGYKMIPRGEPAPMGIPSQSLQLLASRGAAVAVLRSESTDACRVVLFDAASGRQRWSRAVGFAAIASLESQDGPLFIDGDGAVETATGTVLAGPLPQSSQSAKAGVAGDNAWIVVPRTKGKAHLRQIKGGQLKIDTEIALAADLSGAPVPFDDSVVVPLADGFLYRYDNGSKSMIAGPMWKAAGSSADSVCYAVAAGDEILATDGARRLGRWRWPSGAEWSVIGPGFEMRDAIAMKPLRREKTILLASTNGEIALFDQDQPSEPRLRWRPTDDGIPAGRPTLDFQQLGTLVVYAVDARHLVALNPEQSAHAWIVRSDAASFDHLELFVNRGTLYATDLAGIVRAINAQGHVIGQSSPKSRDHSARTGARPHGDKLYLPAADGTILILPNIAP